MNTTLLRKALQDSGIDITNCDDCLDDCTLPAVATILSDPESKEEWEASGVDNINEYVAGNIQDWLVDCIAYEFDAIESQREDAYERRGEA